MFTHVNIYEHKFMNDLRDINPKVCLTLLA